MHCILHIGTEKTGTTLLQKWLYENEKNLKKQKIALTHTSGITNNRSLVSYILGGLDGYLKKKDVFTETEREGFFEDFEGRFEREIAQLKAEGMETCLITSEHFHSRMQEPSQIAELKKFLDRFFDSYSIVCYFREQSKLRTSRYSTLLKGGGATKIEEFDNEADEETHYYNYHLFFKKWEDVFGKAALKPRIFERDLLAEGDLRIDFLRTALPDVKAEALDFEKTSANESISSDQAAFFRTVNGNRPRYVNDHADPTGKILKSVIVKSSPVEKSTPISDDRQVDFYNTFDASNKKFFQEYFGEDGNLFKKPTPPSDTTKNGVSPEVDYATSILDSILSKKNIIGLTQAEINGLRDLAIHLLDKELVHKKDAQLLLKIANRARPGERLMKMKLKELRE